MRRVLFPLAAAAVVLLAPASAFAAWGSAGTGAGAARARVMPSGNQPTVSASGRNVTVSWSASSFSGGPTVNAYRVIRYDALANPQTVGSSCDGNQTGLSCTESSVPAGTWTYSVTPKQGGWLGGGSAVSFPVVIVLPSLSFTPPTTVTALPTTLSGSIASFVTGATVMFRLDDPTSGTVLSSSTTPSPIPTNGAASVNVTIPTGTSLGAHNVFAVGSIGGTASAAITVSDVVPPTVTAEVVGKSTGGTAGFLKQGASYFVYANVSDPAPASGVSTVTANVSAITTGATAISLTSTGGPFVEDGVTYAYRSALQTANAVLPGGSKSFTITATDAASNSGTQGGFTVTVDNTPPSGSDVQTANASGGTAGKAEAGDTITFRFSEPMDPASILAGWGGTATSTTVKIVSNSPHDLLTVLNASGTTQLPLGTVDLGKKGFAPNNQTVSYSGSTMVLSGSTIAITLGTPDIAPGTAPVTGTMTWSPSASATDRADNACGTASVPDSSGKHLEF